MTKSKLNEALRAQYLSLISDALRANGEEVLVVGSNEIAFPCVDGEGNDEYLVVTVKVPKGSRDGEPYDGHEVARDYEFRCAEKAEKAKAAAEAKVRKIERDRKAREAKAEAKRKAQESAE